MNVLSYAFPSFAHLPQVLQKLNSQPTTLLLIALAWLVMVSIVASAVMVTSSAVTSEERSSISTLHSTCLCFIPIQKCYIFTLGGYAQLAQRTWFLSKSR